MGFGGRRCSTPEIRRGGNIPASDGVLSLRDLRALRGENAVPLRPEPVDGASFENLSFEIAPLRRQIIR